MALIKINNTAQVISDAEEVATTTVELKSAAISIEYILNEVKSYWEQTQQDAQTFSEGLQKNLEKLNNIIECNNEFSQMIINYAENQEKTGQNAVS